MKKAEEERDLAHTQVRAEVEAEPGVVTDSKKIKIGKERHLVQFRKKEIVVGQGAKNVVGQEAKNVNQIDLMKWT